MLLKEGMNPFFSFIHLQVWVKIAEWYNDKEKNKIQVLVEAVYFLFSLII